uniref:Alkaline ceramidase n=1 Tax=Scleropages formosus TaxID=113540 RepID=A0A8C9TWP0_SCLFO
MIIPPIFGAIQTFRDGMEVRYVFAFLGLAAVGVGSWCFHMTLQYEMQLLDELPMIYSCCVFVYCLYECFKQENTVHHLVIVILFMFSVIVTVVSLKIVFICNTVHMEQTFKSYHGYSFSWVSHLLISGGVIFFLTFPNFTSAA